MRKCGQTLVRYLQIVILLVYDKREKARDIMSQDLERSGRIYGLKELRKVQRQNNVKEYVNSMVSSWCTHGVCMDNGDEEWGLGYNIRAHVYGMLALKQTYGG